MNCTKEQCRPRNVFEELDRGFNALVRGVLSPDASISGSLPLTFVELEDRYAIECDLPGIALEDISLSVEEHVLTISGQRRKADLPEAAKVLLNERRSSVYSRSIQLPQNADAGRVDAELANGVLVVTVQKRTEVLPKKIQIRRSGSES